MEEALVFKQLYLASKISQRPHMVFQRHKGRDLAAAESSPRGKNWVGKKIKSPGVKFGVN
jgi:hypothetical protein